MNTFELHLFASKYFMTETVKFRSMHKLAKHFPRMPLTTFKKLYRSNRNLRAEKFKKHVINTNTLLKSIKVS